MSPCGVRSVTRRALAVSLVALACASGASGAAARSPWWGVTVFSRPASLQAGQGRDDIQEVRLTSAEGDYILAKHGNAGGPSYVLLSANASAGQVQKALEHEEMFGPGNVRVRSAPGPAGGRAYRITFVGALEDQSLAVLEAKSLIGAEVSTESVVEGRPDGVIVVNLVNRGDANIDPAGQPVLASDVLPAGMKALAIEGYAIEDLVGAQLNGPLECEVAPVSCTFTGKAPAGVSAKGYPQEIPPYTGIRLLIGVRLTGGQPGAVDEVSATGGGAPAISVRRPLNVGSAPLSFGVSDYEMSAEEPGGTPDAKAGSHPFQLTTTLMLNDGFEDKSLALAKDLSFKLPPGLIGNPEPVARCTMAQFLTVPYPTCPQQSVVGAAVVYAGFEFEQGDSESAGSLVAPGIGRFLEPLVNLEPETGEPARFGFVVNPFGEFAPVILDTAVRTGGDYGVTVNVNNITQSASFVGSEVTFWGVPGDEAHNESRGEGCLVTAVALGLGNPPPHGHESACAPFESHNPPPLLSMPTSCTGPLRTEMEADSWLEPAVRMSTPSTQPLPAMDGCNRLPFAPSIKVTPDATQASKPTGLNVDVHVPQELTLNPHGLAESEVRSITVALPEGVAIDPAGGDGLEACGEGLVGYGGSAESPLEPGVSNPVFSSVLPGSDKSSERLQSGVNFCPNASKIGTVTIHTPLLPDALEGAVYLATQEANPFGSLVAMYVVAEDPVSGTLVKLPGVVHLTPSGQIVSTFEDTPQLPFEDAELHFFGGERAPLTSPSRCGAYTTDATYTPWSGNENIDATSTFEVTTGPNGSPCPGASLPFSPSLTAGTTSIQAGGFSPFTMTMSREDGQQALQAITLHMPEGLSGLLAGVELCGEAQANTGTCGPNSQIGETTVGVGVGGDPFTVTGGKVFITGPYKGAPFGLSIVNPAKAGPFDLEHTAANHPACDCLVVRAKLEVNPHTAAITVTSDTEGPYKIPTVLEGIPLQIKHVNVTVGRPGFIFNPTSCDKNQITGSIDSAEGASQTLGVPFQATNCATLAFKPKFAVSTAGKTSRLNGASLNVKLTYPKAPFGSQANIARVKVELPKALPSRLTTLQKACTSEQFHANPSGCPQASIVGHARAITPLVPVPLEGPAYFVSNGNESFPNLVLVLQGYGVTIDLVGDTFISKTGITSSTFKTVPDAPVGSFELNLPEGPYSALAANGSLCKKKLAMPTEFLAQNGAQIKTTTKIQVTGCPKAKKVGHRKKKAAHHKKPGGRHRG